MKENYEQTISKSGSSSKESLIQALDDLKLKNAALENTLQEEVELRVNLLAKQLSLLTLL